MWRGWTRDVSGFLTQGPTRGDSGVIRLVTSLNARATADRACKGSPGPGGRESSDPAPGEGSDSIPGGRTWVADRARGEGEGRAHREEVRPCPEERARLEQPHNVSLNESQNMNGCPLALYLLTLGQVLDVSDAPDTRRPLTRHRPHFAQLPASRPRPLTRTRAHRVSRLPVTFWVPPILCSIPTDCGATGHCAASHSHVAL